MRYARNGDYAAAIAGLYIVGQPCVDAVAIHYRAVERYCRRSLFTLLLLSLVPSHSCILACRCVGAYEYCPSCAQPCSFSLASMHHFTGLKESLIASMSERLRSIRRGVSSVDSPMYPTSRRTASTIGAPIKVGVAPGVPDVIHLECPPVRGSATAYRAIVRLNTQDIVVRLQQRTDIAVEGSHPFPITATVTYTGNVCFGRETISKGRTDRVNVPTEVSAVEVMRSVLVYTKRVSHVVSHLIDGV